MTVSKSERPPNVQPYVHLSGSATILDANPLDGQGAVVYGIGMTTKRSAPVRPAQDDETPSSVLQRRFGENFREARLAAGLNQREVAVRSGVHQEQVSLIERGMVNLTLRTMERLAQVVDHGADHLLQEKPVLKAARRS